MAGRRHHYIMPRLGGMFPTFHTTPTLDYSIGGNAAFQDFIPPNDALSLTLKKFGNALNKVGLKLSLIFYFLLFNSALTFIALLPAKFRSLITPNMNVL